MPHYLICYDISNEKRLQRVRKRAIKNALYIQRSVYYMSAPKTVLNRLLDDLKKLIDECYDDIRVYNINPLSTAEYLGVHWIPEGIGFYD